MSNPILDVEALASIVAARVVDELEARARRNRQVLIAPGEMAARLKLTEKTLANLRSKGTGPKWTKIGGRVRYPVPGDQIS